MISEKSAASKLSLQDLADIAEVSSGMPIWENNTFQFHKNGETVELNKIDVIEVIKTRLQEDYPIFANLPDNAFDEGKTWGSISEVLKEQLARENTTESAVPAELESWAKAKEQAETTLKSADSSKKTTHERVGEALKTQAKLSKEPSEAKRLSTKTNQGDSLHVPPRPSSKEEKPTQPVSKGELRPATKDAIERAERRAEARGVTFLEKPLGHLQEQWGEAIASVLHLGDKYRQSSLDGSVAEAGPTKELTSAVTGKKSKFQPSSPEREVTKLSIGESTQPTDKVSTSTLSGALKTAASAILTSPSIQNAAAGLSSTGQILASKGLSAAGQGVINATFYGLNVLGSFFSNPQPVYVSPTAISDSSSPPDNSFFADHSGPRSARRNRRIGSPLSNASSLANKAFGLRNLIGGARTAAAIIGGVSSGTIAAVGIAALLIILLIIAFIMMPFIMQQFHQQAESPHKSAPSLFTLEKASSVSQIPNFKDAVNDQQVTYTLTFDTRDQKLAVTITDSIMAYTQTGEFAGDQIQAIRSPSNFPTTLDSTNNKLTYTLTIPANPFNKQTLNDGILVNTVTVKGEVIDGEKAGQTETKTALATVLIGNPPGGIPYGFPKAGSVNGHFDTYPVPAITLADGDTLPAHEHCGEILLVDKSEAKQACMEGGIDIGGSGEVRSTADGFVIYSNFENRHGGVIIIAARNYTAAYLHLAEEGLAPLGKINRGDNIGSVYTKYPDPGLETSSGSHVHYQVLRNGSNLLFGDKSNIGVCSTGKAIISQLNYSQMLIGTVQSGDGAGNFVCTDSP